MRKSRAMRSVLDCTLLETFIRVADLGNISAAARSLFIAQSAVSMQMTQLGRAAATPLLERVHGRWKLTAAGVIFYRRAREVLAMVDDLEREIDDASAKIAGHIVIASTRTVSDTILATIVAGFTRAHPDIRLDIAAGNRHDAEMHLAADDIDGALVALPIGGKSLRVSPLVNDRLALVVPAAHPLATRASIPFRACASEAFVMFESGSGVRAILEERLGERFDALDVRLELTSNDALIRCVEAGIGLTFLPERVALKWIPNTPIAMIGIDDVDLTRTLAFVATEGRAPSAALATFETWLQENVTVP